VKKNGGRSRKGYLGGWCTSTIIAIYVRYVCIAVYVLNKLDFNSGCMLFRPPCLIELVSSTPVIIILMLIQIQIQRRWYADHLNHSFVFISRRKAWFKCSFSTERRIGSVHLYVHNITLTTIHMKETNKV
jgi:hypothetical protein